MRTMRLLGVVVATASAVLAVAACSDDDDTGAGATLPEMATTTSTTSTVAPTTTQPRFYEVQSGDTLTEIAAAYGLPIQAIMEANGIVDPNMIQAGQILELPLASAIVATSLPPVTTTPGVTAAFPSTTTIAP
jgi:LysM repeat protein